MMNRCLEAVPKPSATALLSTGVASFRDGFLVLALALFLGARTLLAVPELPDIKSMDDVVEEEERAVKHKKEHKKGQSVGSEMRKFGEEVASRVDSVIKKKTFELWGDPWTMQGIPLIFPSSENGFNLGLKVALQNVRRQDPHKVELEAQVLASDKGRYKHMLRLDYPHALDGKVRFTARVAYDRDINLRYFGIGNETPVDKGLLDADSLLYRNVRAGPSFTFQILRYFGRYVRAGPVLGLKWTDITFPTGSLLDRERPAGIRGGRTHSLGVSIIHDTLDWEPYPSRGSFYELYVGVSDTFTGSDYSFVRATFTHRRYTLLHRKLILANRTLFEVLSGDVPYYELGAVGGSYPALALGGDRYYRGYEANRFIDKLRLAVGFELRWDPLFFLFAKQDITVGFVPFFDIGRVWPSVFPLRLGTWHASAGWGARIIWNSRFVIRADFAVNDEGSSLILNLGNSF